MTKQLKINSSILEVKYVKNLRDDGGEEMLGTHYHNMKEMQINSAYPLQTQRQTLLHESIHAIFSEYGLKDEKDCMEFIEPLSNALYAFLIDNKEFIKEIIR